MASMQEGTPFPHEIKVRVYFQDALARAYDDTDLRVSFDSPGGIGGNAPGQFR